MSGAVHTVELGGQRYQVLPTILRDVERMTQLIKPVAKALREDGLSIGSEEMGMLIEFVALGLKRGHPEVTADKLRDLPIGLEELLTAFTDVMAHGLRLKPRAAPAGEAQGAPQTRT